MKAQRALLLALIAAGFIFLVVNNAGFFSATTATVQGVDELPEGTTCKSITECATVGGCESVCDEYITCDVYTYKNNLIACIQGDLVPPQFEDVPQTSEEANADIIDSQFGEGSS